MKSKAVTPVVIPYYATRNPQTKEITVVYDDKNIHDEETRYTFMPDGSATSLSLAWGIQTKCPPGTFSSLLVKLPENGKIKPELAQMMAKAYQNSNPTIVPRKK